MSFVHEPDRQFSEHLSNHLEFLANRASSGRTRSSHEAKDGRNELFDLIANEKVSPLAVIHGFLDALREYPTLQLPVIYLMRDVHLILRDSQRYAIPELFWLIVQTGLPSELEEHDHVISALVDLGGREAVRSILVPRLIEATDLNREQVLRSFYFTGHSIETLRIAVQIAPVTSEDSYSKYTLFDAVRLVFELTGRPPETDYQFLHDLLRQGLTLLEPDGIDRCREAVARLTNLTVNENDA